jgi:hypothetical protein
LEVSSASIPIGSVGTGTIGAETAYRIVLSIRCMTALEADVPA